MGPAKYDAAIPHLFRDQVVGAASLCLECDRPMRARQIYVYLLSPGWCYYRVYSCSKLSASILSVSTHRAVYLLITVVSLGCDTEISTLSRMIRENSSTYLPCNMQKIKALSPHCGLGPGSLLPAAGGSPPKEMPATYVSLTFINTS